MKDVWFATYCFIGADGNMVQIPIKENNKIRTFNSESALQRYLNKNTSNTGVIYEIHKGLIKVN